VEEHVMNNNKKSCFAECTKSALQIFNITRRLIFLLLLTAAFTARAEEVIRMTSGIGPPAASAAADGIYDLLIREIFRRIDDYQVQIENYTVARDLSVVNDGLADGLGGRTGGLEKDYPNIRQVPEAFVDFEFTGFSKRQDISLTGWDSLRTYNVTYPGSWIFYQRHVRAKSILKARTYEQLFELLQQNRVDIVLFEKLMGLYILKQSAIADVELIELPIDPVKLYLYFHKKHTPLIPRVAAALRAMKRDGSYQEIYNRALRHYLGDDAPLLK
jgi:polar amino acid transport system substrate-binding protein